MSSASPSAPSGRRRHAVARTQRRVVEPPPPGASPRAHRLARAHSCRGRALGVGCAWWVAPAPRTEELAPKRPNGSLSSLSLGSHQARHCIRPFWSSIACAGVAARRSRSRCCRRGTATACRCRAPGGGYLRAYPPSTSRYGAIPPSSNLRLSTHGSTRDSKEWSRPCGMRTRRARTLWTWRSRTSPQRLATSTPSLSSQKTHASGYCAKLRLFRRRGCPHAGRIR